MIKRARGSDEVLGYFICDEPGASQFPRLAKAVEYVRKYDPGKIAYIDRFTFEDYTPYGPMFGVMIADGSGIVDGRVGMVGKETGILEIDVPAGASVEQALLYWIGGSTIDVGDDTIEVDGTPVTGTLIGGPTNFYQNMDFYAYRVDITDMGIVVPGANSFEISGFDFDWTGNVHDEGGGSTTCHECGELLIGRDWYRLGSWRLDDEGRCLACGIRCPGQFDSAPGTWGAQRAPLRISRPKL